MRRGQEQSQRKYEKHELRKIIPLVGKIKFFEILMQTPGLLLENPLC
jgi:hypothetical protein